MSEMSRKAWQGYIAAILLTFLVSPLLPGGSAAAGEIKPATGRGVVTFRAAPASTAETQPGRRIVAPATAQGIVIYRPPASNCPKGSERIADRCVRSCPSEMYRYRGKCLCPDGLVRDGNHCKDKQVVVTCKLPKILRDGQCVLPPCPGDTFRSGWTCHCDYGLIRHGDKCTKPPQIVISPETLPSGIEGRPFPILQFIAGGGTAPYNFAIANGALPDGLMVTPAGRLAGVPLRKGVFSFMVRATDAKHFNGTRSYSITIREKAGPSPTDCPRGMVRFGANCVSDGSGGETGGVTPPGPPDTSTGSEPGTGSTDLARPLQRELKRLGCLSGSVDGIWGSGSRAALSRFVRKSGFRLNRREPTEAALRAAQDKPDDYCAPARCRNGYHHNNQGSCIKDRPRACGSNQYRNNNGNCVCDTGYERRGNKCRRVRTPVYCGAHAYVKNNGRCACDTGYERRGNKCRRVKTPVYCGAHAYVKNNGRCACDTGYERRGNRCRRIRQQQNSETTGGNNARKCKKRRNKCTVRAIGCMLKYNNKAKCQQQARQCMGNCR